MTLTFGASWKLVRPVQQCGKGAVVIMIIIALEAVVAHVLDFNHWFFILLSARLNVEECGHWEPSWTVSATHTTMHSGDNKLKIEVRVSPRHLTGLSTAMLIIQLFIQYDFKHAGAQRILEKENRNLIVKRNAIHVSLMCRIDDQRILQTSQAKKLKQKCALKKLGSSSPSVSYRVRIDARRILETCQTERHPCLTDTDAHSRSKNTPNLPS